VITELAVRRLCTTGAPEVLKLLQESITYNNPNFNCFSSMSNFPWSILTHVLNSRLTKLEIKWLWAVIRG